MIEIRESITKPTQTGNQISGLTAICHTVMERTSATENSIPAESIRSGISIPASQDREEPARISLLYVDDDPDQLSLCKIFLERTGDFLVDTTVSPKTALQMIQSSGYTVIVSDYQMPEMNGIEFFSEVERIYGNIPFVLFTAREWEEVFSPGSNETMDFYVHKCGNSRAQYAALGRVIREAATSGNTNAGS